MSALIARIENRKGVVMKHEFLEYEVWRTDKTKQVSRQVAGFRYWLECLDYLEYCHKLKADVVLRTKQTGNWQVEYRNHDRLKQGRF